MVWTEIRKILIIIFGALLNAIALNVFLIPANVYASGFSGASQLIATILEQPGLTGIILFILNIPVTILGWKKVGKLFTIYSFLSVIMLTFFLEIIPIVEQTEDILLYSVFGGVTSAIGVGLTMKFGASTGGMDIIAMVLSRMKDKPVGTYFFILNSLIIVIAGVYFEPEKALYTLVALYATTRVIDVIHTRHEKLTVMIVSSKAEELEAAIHARLVRGITTVPARGAFSKEDKNMLVMVITRYELYDLEHTIREVDPNAFTNVVQTTSVFGFFRKD
ncbi:YitT family protein [Bacillaceae bacterium SIJ1]|uniref:YitT family protein n=1 Tax=Litoribacterium kuwaitense TaxID=1398745 RepID=UPI0013ECB59E|nr:YitT family protein [Litoribacterium kuwaitense]NGP44541.1 YitT family protein [Litoribacterium kuwaitense]